MADTLAFRNNKLATTRRLASEVGFCVIDSNADVIAGNLIDQIREMAAGLEEKMNRLYRGREAYILTEGQKQTLIKAAGRLIYSDRTASEILEAQEPVTFQQAAE